MFRRAVSSNNAAPPAALLLACALLLCAGCAAREAPPGMKIVKESQHANGLTVGVPEGFEARQTGDGFVVEPQGNQNLRVRYPVTANVSLVKGGAPDDSSLRTKSVGGKEVRYGVTKSENPSSSDDTYALEVFERVPGGRIRYTQAMQSEMGEPGFDLCWALVGSTKYREPR
jgi:hypothetical protein